MLLLAGWLGELYHLSRDFLLFMGVVNLVYASYSLPLAMSSRRSRARVHILAVGNMVWGVACLCFAAYFMGTASILGMVHLVGEGIIVGGMGCLEWRWRAFLYSADA
jgi:hypothetical protein